MLCSATLKVCGTFKSVFFDYKSLAADECPNNPWRSPNSALFGGLDAFLERCHDLLDLLRTIVQFQKLEKIEVGGNKGRTLSASVSQIHADFQSMVLSLTRVGYDVLDVELKQFDADFHAFRGEMKARERRISHRIASHRIASHRIA
jgi:dynein heavy chain